jgi:uncharacterized RDD family membrane protein YckC
MEYSGFWRRFVAYVIDNILLSVVFWLLVLVLGGIGGDGGVFGAYTLAAIGWLLYYAAMESSSNQATVGKMALGIKVTDLEGNRISFGRAVGRNLAKIISVLIFYIGFIMAAFTAKKQALQDMIAGTLVVKKGSTTPMASADVPM